jgi:M6 family metalloprotease-like protein
MKRFNGKRMTAGLVMVLACVAAHAGVPYKNHTYDYKQPNGDMLSVVVDGNSYYAEERTTDGKLVIFDKVKKGLCYAVVNAAGDGLVSTGVLATKSTLRSAAGAASKQPGLSKEARALRAKQRYQKMHGQPLEAANDKLRSAAMVAATTGVSPMAVATGPMRGLTVIIEFPDLPGTISQSQVSSFLNDVPYTGFGNAQSVRGYFQSVSGNKLDYTNTVSRYYRAKQPKAYYADASLEADVRSQELINEALNWLKTTEKFDFSTLSRDSNNRILGLNFMYTGEPDSPWSKGLWPHQWNLVQPFCAGTVCAHGYQISNMGTQMSIGTFVHESGHLVMDWPDLYDYDGSSDGSIGAFCLMASGSVGPQNSLRPVPPNGFFRYLAGWDTATELNPAINRTAPTGRLSHTSGSHALYRWTNQANPSEAFYVEAMHKSDQNLFQPDQGLAVFHIDPSGDNSTEWKPYVQMEHADGRRDPENNVNGGDATDLYDGVATRAFNDTVPNALTSRGTNSKWWNGFASGFAIANISAPAKTITFDVGSTIIVPPVQTYTGSLTSKAQAIHPPSGFDYAGGTIKATLKGPATGADFDLKLERRVNNVWQRVASSTSATSNESISYVAAAGFYRITVLSYSGAGSYTLTVSK